MVKYLDYNVNTIASQVKFSDPQQERKNSTPVDESASGEEMGMMHNCGLLPNNCLPCLAGTTSSYDEKRKSISTSPRKKPVLRLSFKWKDGQANPTICKHRLSISCFCLHLVIIAYLSCGC